MATLWGLAAAILKPSQVRRYGDLCSQIAPHHPDSLLVGTENSARLLVAIHAGLQPSEWDSLSPVERIPFLESAIKSCANKHNETSKPEQKCGRPPSEIVAKRRREVRRLKDKGMVPSEIAAELLKLRHSGKLPADLEVGVEVVKKDMQRCES